MMAGTSHPGVTDATLGWDLAGDFIGANPNGCRIPWNQWTAGDGGQPDWHDPFQFLAAGGARTAAGGGAVKPAATEHAGEDEATRTSFGLDWFERVHVLPRVKIDFGNIITLEQDEYELYNAFRNASVQLNSLVNNVAPGIEFPNLSVPSSVGPQCSFLDPTSTGNGAGTGLGTLVKLKVNALSDGLPIFDSDVVFTFDSGDVVSLLLAGSRIVLMPMEYEAPVKEVLAWLTDIIEAVDGSEQRIALRKNPRQVFEVVYKLDGNDRQRMQMLLMDWTDNVFGFPLWHEKLKLTAAVSAGATTYQVANADEVDLRVGGLAVVFTDSNTFDVINISALTSTQITAADPSVNAYPAGTTIMPLRTARIVGAVAAVRSPVTLEEFRIRFEVTDNDTGALTGSTAAYSTYNSRVLFDDCNVIAGGAMPGEYKRRIYRIDNSTGKVEASSSWDRNKRSTQKGFVLRNRAEILAFRKMLLSIRGRQKAFYMPTFIEDLEVKATLVTGANTMDIERIEYERFAQSRFPKTVFRITFTDGTSLVREVQSAASVDSTTERLTLDTTWPANRTVDEIVRVQFYELLRFDADSVPIEYPRIGLATARMPCVQVFDDN